MAATHYATSIDLDADFRRAVALPSGEQQKAQQSASADGEHGVPANTPDHAATPKKQGSDTREHVSANAVRTDPWALQDSNL